MKWICRILSSFRPRRRVDSTHKEFDIKGWRRFHGIATRWRDDLQQYAADEQRQRGAASAATRELLDDAESNIRMSKSKLDVAEIANATPIGSCRLSLCRRDTAQHLQRGLRRKSIQRNPSLIATGNRRDLARSPASRAGLDEEVLDELAVEANDVEAFLAADDRTEQEIIDDALQEAELIDASCDEKIDDEFDSLVSDDDDREFEALLTEELFG